MFIVIFIVMFIVIFMVLFIVMFVALFMVMFMAMFIVMFMVLLMVMFMVVPVCFMVNSFASLVLWSFFYKTTCEWGLVSVMARYVPLDDLECLA